MEHYPDNQAGRTFAIRDMARNLPHSSHRVMRWRAAVKLYAGKTSRAGSPGERLFDAALRVGAILDPFGWASHASREIFESMAHVLAEGQSC